MGNKVECPVCSKRFRKFLPYGRNSRENALCPNCLALERHRLMWLFLKKKTEYFSADLEVLHVAPELCFIDRFESLPNIRYTSADFESPLAKVKMDIHEMPFAEQTFDVVFCNHVMEHVIDDRKAMKEIFRVLKPGGWSIIQIPVFNPRPEVTTEDPAITNLKERERLFGQDDHVRLYGFDYPDRLKEAGFEVSLEDFSAELGKELAEMYALPVDDPIHFCRKPTSSIVR